ncbi:MAG: hypothetical protein HZB13_07340 [Acidobacteria bacterium]|nr:hypothetical protein [Acidobacteriota bacterium]
MKKLNSLLAVGTVLALVVLLAAPSANAQASKTTLRANVPFAFVAGDKVFPAGPYSIEMDSAVKRVLLQSDVGSNASYFLPMFNYVARPSGGPGSLIFHKAGNAYFLHKLVGEGGTKEIEWQPTKTEREAARKSGIEVAAIPVTTSQVRR